MEKVHDITIKDMETTELIFIAFAVGYIVRPFFDVIIKVFKRIRVAEMYLKQADEWIRLWIWNACPKCNHKAPAMYECPICDLPCLPIKTITEKLRIWNKLKLNKNLKN